MATETTSKNVKTPAQKKRKTLIIVVVITIALLSIDIFYTGFIKYGYTVVKCGQAPVAVHPSVFSTSSLGYLMPGDYFPGGAYNKYYCSEDEAQARGLTRSVF